MEAIRQKLAIGTNLDKVQREYHAYLGFYLKPRPIKQVRVAILAQGRTGSTLLESLLCSTNQFQCNGELLSQFNSPFQWKIVSPFRYVGGLSRLSENNFIFHIKPYHLTKEQGISLSQFLKQIASDEWKIIHLCRENKVMHVISNIIALKRGNYHKLDDRKENFLLEIDIQDFVKRVQNKIQYDKLERECLRSLEHIRVVYENHLENPRLHQKTTNMICAHLGIPSGPVKTNLRKINTHALRDIVKNYDELERCIIENGWGYFLP